MKFIILYRGISSRGASYYKLYVEIFNGYWEEATYFGSTKPKCISKLKIYKDGWIAEIQPHTSRSQKTGQFKGARKAA